jgi:hypothetical protein
LFSVSDNGQLAQILSAIEKINHRLDRLEERAASAANPPSLLHPSLDKLSIAEAIADSIFGPNGKEKACTFEPSRPCDHCSMCNSRGF